MMRHLSSGDASPWTQTLAGLLNFLAYYPTDKFLGNVGMNSLAGYATIC